MTLNKAKPLASARIRKKQKKKEKVISQQWLGWIRECLAVFRVNLYFVFGP